MTDEIAERKLMTEWAKKMRKKDSDKGINRYEVKCFDEDKKLIRFFADWTMEHTLTIEELRRLLDGDHKVKR